MLWIARVLVRVIIIIKCSIAEFQRKQVQISVVREEKYILISQALVGLGFFESDHIQKVVWEYWKIFEISTSING